MKKILFSLLFILSITSNSNAFFGEPNSLDLYLNIDKGIDNLEQRFEEYELNGGEKSEGIIVEINKYAILNNLPSCLDTSKQISTKQFKDIIEKNDISYESGIPKYIKENCISEMLKEEALTTINDEYDNKVKEKEKEITNNESITAATCGNKIIDGYKLVDGKLIKTQKPQDDFECRDEIFKKEEAKLNQERNEKINNYGKKGSNERKSLLIRLINDYLDLFKIYQSDKRQLAEVKASQTYKVSKIGLFADGDIQNSGFDLISDIEQIDKVIFKDVVDYQGSPDSPINDTINDFLKPLNNKLDEVINGKKDENGNTNENQPSKITTNIQIPKINNKELVNNQYQCIDNKNSQNGLSNDTINYLNSSLLNTNKPDNQIKEEIKNNNIEKPSDKNNSNSKNSQGGYSKIGDDWPCDTFFCIQINFRTYEHSLFGGGENVTIEYLLNRSNKHLSKYAGTSLIPAKMGTNQFELGLKDLNLPDVFHLSIQVSSKPVPILSGSNKQEDTGPFSSKEMLKEFYEVNGLDYKRRNDINLLIGAEQDRQNTNNSTGLTPSKLAEKQKENNKIVKERQEKLNTLRKAIDTKASYSGISEFEKQFTELDKFTVGINDYVNNLESLVKNLNKIPIEY